MSRPRNLAQRMIRILRDRIGVLSYAEEYYRAEWEAVFGAAGLSIAKPYQFTGRAFKDLWEYSREPVPSERFNQMSVADVIESGIYCLHNHGYATLRFAMPLLGAGEDTLGAESFVNQLEPGLGTALQRRFGQKMALIGERLEFAQPTERFTKTMREVHIGATLNGFISGFNMVGVMAMPASGYTGPALSPVWSEKIMAGLMPHITDPTSATSKVVAKAFIDPSTNQPLTWAEIEQVVSDLERIDKRTLQISWMMQGFTGEMMAYQPFSYLRSVFGLWEQAYPTAEALLAGTGAFPEAEMPTLPGLGDLGVAPELPELEDYTLPPSVEPEAEPGVEPPPSEHEPQAEPVEPTQARIMPEDTWFDQIKRWWWVLPAAIGGGFLLMKGFKR